MVTMPLFLALYYGVYLESGLPTLVIILTASNQQLCVQTTCLAYVSEKLSILTAFSLFVLLVFELLWVHEPPLLVLVPSVRVIEQACDLTIYPCFVILCVCGSVLFLNQEARVHEINGVIPFCPGYN